LDLLAWVEPIGSYEQLGRSAEEVSYDGAPIKTISLDDLIRVKQHIRRSQDTDSLFQLLAIKKAREDTGKR
jgi:predicted nucleotidyltransferase